MSWVLSIYQNHDASVALVGEGRIIHLEQERYTRIKHDGGHPQRRTYASETAIQVMVAEACNRAGITLDQIDVLAGVGLEDWYGQSGDVNHADPTCRQDRFLPGWNSLDEIQHGTSFGLPPGKERRVIWMSHHFAHAAYAFYSSPHEHAHFIALDGGGDAILPRRDSCYCAQGEMRQPFGETKLKWSGQFRQGPGMDIGGYWNHMGLRLFDSIWQAGSIMALAGIPKEEWGVTGYDEQTRLDIRRLQEDTTWWYWHQTPRNPPEKTVVLAGGCALNGIATYALLQRDDIAHVWVPPSVHDGGLTVGAALYVLHHVLGEPRVPYSPETVAFSGHTEPELEGTVAPETVAHILASSGICAVATGKAESGPRALGHRSLLADPRRMEVKARLNEIKGRQPWRPAAPVAIKSEGEQWGRLVNPDAYNFMTTICEATERLRKECPAAVHHDGSARLQLVGEDSFLGQVVRAFEAETGVAVILNTSLNCAGEAICNTALDALETAKRMGVPVAIGGVLHG
jgi:carbamoyltransferase